MSDHDVIAPEKDELVEELEALRLKYFTGNYTSCYSNCCSRTPSCSRLFNKIAAYIRKEYVRRDEVVINQLKAAVKFVRENYSLPRCEHGNALRDHSFFLLAPECGCKWTLQAEEARPLKVKE